MVPTRWNDASCYKIGILGGIVMKNLSKILRKDGNGIDFCTGLISSSRRVKKLGKHNDWSEGAKNREKTTKLQEKSLKNEENFLILMQQ